MLQYYVVLLLINWPCVRADATKSTSVPDQLAVASASVDEALKKTTTNRSLFKFINDFEDKDSYHHNYENNFQPIVVPDLNYEPQRNSSAKTSAFTVLNAKSVNFSEDDPVYSTEARILFNLPGPSLVRRSFDSDNQYNEFELLKVTNNTPAIAHYHDFYEDPYPANENSEILDHNNEMKVHEQPRYANRDHVYNPDNYPNVRHYSKEKARKTQEKTQVKASQRDEKYSFQRGRQGQKQKFNQPVVVVDPATYKVEMKYSHPTVNTKLANTMNERQPMTMQDKIEPDKNNNYNGGFVDNFDKASTSRQYEGAEDSKDVEDGIDYSDVTERSRKVSKPRKRPYDAGSSKRLQKEHREMYDDEHYESEDRKRYNPTRSKQRYRNRNKQTWSDSNVEDSREEDSRNQDDRTNNNWNQQDSNNLQTDMRDNNQIEKPNLVPVVPLNLVPFGNFDHATALGNSQGFDMSNVMLQNIAPGTTLVSTASPLISTAQSFVRNKGSNGLNLMDSDVIMGQNSMHNPVQTVLISQPKQNGKTQYLQNTVTPIYALSTTASPSSQSQSTTASRPIFAASTTVAPVQHLAINSLQTGVPVNQLLLSQPTLQTLANIGQVNDNLQNSAFKSGNFYQVLSPKSKNYLQNAQIIPAFLHTGINLNTQSDRNQNTYNPFASTKTKDAQILKATNEAFESSMKQLQHQIMKNQGGSNYQADTIASTSNTNLNVANAGPNNNLERAQLPNLGTKNVEILNPNLKQSTVAGLTLASPIGVINQYPATLLTTPIPILSSTNFAAVRPVISTSAVDQLGLNSYVDTLTELGSKINAGNTQALYNPIQFVPNINLLKNQNILNHNGQSNDNLQQDLNLVPQVAGGNFYKNNNNELTSKPKLNSDLEKYAEEMLKESLRTIYNTHKWNNDRKFPRNISLVDSSPAAKLRNELLRIKPGKDYTRDTETHQTENKYHVVDSRPSKGKPDFTMAKLEELLMKDFKIHSASNNEPIHVFHHHGHKQGYSRPSDQGSSYSHNEPKNVRHEINDYLTPPKPNSFVSKSPFHDKPVKKRPGRYNGHDHHPRHPPRPKSAPKSTGPEPAGSHLYEYTAPYDSYTGGYHRHRDHRNSDHRKGHHFDHFYYPFTDSSGERKSRDFLDINNPRTHNLIGLLMKNNKLPPGSPQSLNRDYDDLESLFNESKESQQMKQYQHLDLSVFQKKADVHPNLTTSNTLRLRTRHQKRT